MHYLPFITLQASLHFVLLHYWHLLWEAIQSKGSNRGELSPCLTTAGIGPAIFLSKPAAAGRPERPRCRVFGRQRGLCAASRGLPGKLEVKRRPGARKGAVDGLAGSSRRGGAAGWLCSDEGSRGCCYRHGEVRRKLRAAASLEEPSSSSPSYHSLGTVYPIFSPPSSSPSSLDGKLRVNVFNTPTNIRSFFLQRPRHAR